MRVSCAVSCQVGCLRIKRQSVVTVWLGLGNGSGENYWNCAVMFFIMHDE